MTPRTPAHQGVHKGQKIVSKCLTVFFLSFCLRIYEYAFLSIIIFFFFENYCVTQVLL